MVGTDVGRCVATDGDGVLVGDLDGSTDGLDVTGTGKLDVGELEGKELREESQRPRPSLTELKITSELATEHCELRIKDAGGDSIRSIVDSTMF